jgi:hypothetical protein
MINKTCIKYTCSPGNRVSFLKLSENFARWGIEQGNQRLTGMMNVFMFIQS